MNMIDLQLYISFVVVAAVVIVVPGPNVLLIVATSLTHGRLRGLQTIAGTLAAMAIQLYIAARGTALLATTLAAAFDVLRWLGAAYLLWLGCGHLRAALRSGSGVERSEVSAAGSFRRGFFVGITNPKTILFFGALLPQFTVDSLPIGPQTALLSVSFLLLAALFDGIYALAAGRVREFARCPTVRRWLDGTAGALLFGSGVGLALARRG
jgi:threonine/homoserine/homoserine lactone efflux protein